MEVDFVMEIYISCYSIYLFNSQQHNSPYLSFFPHKQLKQSEKLIICGQALSHCVNYTIRDIISHWPKDRMDNIIILKDCSSTIPGFETVSDELLREMIDLGVRVETTDSFKLL